MRFWLGLTILLVFAAGGAIGVVLGRTHFAVSEKGALPPVDSYSTVPPDLLASEAVYDEIGLDDAQRTQVDAALASHYRRLREARTTLRNLTLELRQAISQILGPEQRTRLEEIQSRYGERELQDRVGHELVGLRMELDLAPEQETKVYQVLYDTARAGREHFRKMPGPKDWDEGRKKWEALIDERDARLLEVFDQRQREVYEERRRREKEWWKDGGGRRDGRGGPPQGFPKAPRDSSGEHQDKGPGKRGGGGGPPPDRPVGQPPGEPGALERGGPDHPPLDGSPGGPPHSEAPRQGPAPGPSESPLEVAPLVISPEVETPSKEPTETSTEAKAESSKPGTDP